MKRQPKHDNSRPGQRSPVSEDQIIERLRRSGARRDRAAGLGLGVGDDAALFSPRSGFETVLTCDWFLEGTHFLRDKHPADAIGWKCLARAVSDIAAMGGTPRCFLLGLALPTTHTSTWLDGFLSGLRRAQRRLGCALAGGDTSKSNRILIQVTVIGEVRNGKAVLRSGAKPGDIVFVSGRLGEAELGLRRLRYQKRIDPADPALRKHLYPEPRLRLGSWLAANQLATAMLDLSDGLSTDLARLCAASGVGARIEAARLPLPTKAGNRVNLSDLALHGGDDYELLFTVSPKKIQRIPEYLGTLPLTKIGTITRSRGLRFSDTEGSEHLLNSSGWDPFRTKNGLVQSTFRPRPAPYCPQPDA
jgi:thiamine-monophosphate kinase